MVAQPGTRGDQLAQGVGVVLDAQRVRLGEHGQQRPTRLPGDIQRDGWGRVVVDRDGRGRPGGAGVGGDRGGGDRAGHPDADGQRPPGPPVLVGQMGCAVEQAAPPGAVQGAVDGGPELAGAGGVDLGRRHDVDLPGMLNQQPVPPAEQAGVAGHRCGDGEQGDAGQPRPGRQPPGEMVKQRPQTGRCGCRRSGRCRRRRRRRWRGRAVDRTRWREQWQHG